MVVKISDQQKHYRPNWEDSDQFPDIAVRICKGKNNQCFCCKIWKNGSLKLSNMGIRALRSYIKPSKPDNPSTKYERLTEVS